VSHDLSPVLQSELFTAQYLSKNVRVRELTQVSTDGKLILLIFTNSIIDIKLDKTNFFNYLGIQNLTQNSSCFTFNDSNSIERNRLFSDTVLNVRKHIF